MIGWLTGSRRVSDASIAGRAKDSIICANLPCRSHKTVGVGGEALKWGIVDFSVAAFLDAPHARMRKNGAGAGLDDSLQALPGLIPFRRRMAGPASIGAPEDGFVGIAKALRDGFQAGVRVVEMGFYDLLVLRLKNGPKRGAFGREMALQTARRLPEFLRDGCEIDGEMAEVTADDDLHLFGNRATGVLRQDEVGDMAFDQRQKRGVFGAVKRIEAALSEQQPVGALAKAHPRAKNTFQQMIFDAMES